MVEATGMGAIKLDVAVYTIRALNDLVEMAQSKGDAATAGWAANKSAALSAKFLQDWWIPADGLSSSAADGSDRSYRYDRIAPAIHTVPATLLDKRYPDGDGNCTGPGRNDGIRKSE